MVPLSTKLAMCRQITLMLHCYAMIIHYPRDSTYYNHKEKITEVTFINGRLDCRTLYHIQQKEMHINSLLHIKSMAIYALTLYTS